MTYYKNAVCPVCKELLTEQDDVVVCPECGAPYHRACYKEAGRCLYEELHGTGFAYLPDPAPEEEEAPQVLCPRCHKSNPADAHACGNCGTPLTVAENDRPFESIPAYRRSRSDVNPDTEKFRPTDSGRIRFGFDAEEEEFSPDETLRAQLDAADIRDDEVLDGFTLKEWLSYIGPSAPIYLFRFKQMDRSRHGRAFSLAAALFAPVYFLYRKMWGWGVLALLGKVLCLVPSLLMMAEVYGLAPVLPLSEVQLQQYSLYLTYLDFALSFFWGMAAFTLYRRRCVRDIGQIKAAFAAQASTGSENDSLYMRLSQAGGVSLVGVTVLGALGMLLYLPSLLMLWM